MSKTRRGLPMQQKGNFHIENKSPEIDFITQSALARALLLLLSWLLLLLLLCCHALMNSEGHASLYTPEVMGMGPGF